MKYLMIPVLLVLCAAGSSQAQTQPSQSHAQPVQQPAQTEDSNPDTTATRQRYDPLAGKEHLRGGIWDNALKKINPCDIDYGARVDAWQRMIVDETIANYVFWIAVAMSLAMLFALLYIYWLHKDRDRRLDISVNILTQIANAFIDARDHALDAIERHNQLADDYNEMAEKMASLEQQKSNTQKLVRGEATSESEVEEQQTDASAVNPVPGATAFQQLDPQLLAQLRQSTETAVQQRFARQVAALNEKNKTLRISMNELIAENERLKQQCATLKGA